VCCVCCWASWLGYSPPLLDSAKKLLLVTQVVHTIFLKSVKNLSKLDKKLRNIPNLPYPIKPDTCISEYITLKVYYTRFAVSHTRIAVLYNTYFTQIILLAHIHVKITYEILIIDRI